MSKRNPIFDALLVAALLALALLLFPRPAKAQGVVQCLPAERGLGTEKASAMIVSYDREGRSCLRYYCFLDNFTPQWPNAVQLNQWCGTRDEMSKVGSRIATIARAKDPLKSLQDASKRFPMVPLSHPSMASMPR